jgi:hypothetical protein
MSDTLKQLNAEAIYDMELCILESIKEFTDHTGLVVDMIRPLRKMTAGPDGELHDAEYIDLAVSFR